MKFGLSGSALGVLVSIAACAPAADDTGNYAIWGTGARSCNQFLCTKSDDAGKLAFKHYLMGYLTAQNTVQDDTYDTTGHMSLDDVLIWLKGYCKAHKLDSFERAISQFLVEHYYSRLRYAPGAPAGWGNPANVAQ